MALGAATPASASGSPNCTASQPEQVMVTNGSMEAAALLFRHLVLRRETE